MPEPESHSKAIREWITGLLLPLAIFAYTYQKDQSDEKSRELDRVATIIKSLGSTSSLERELSRTYIQYLYKNHLAPAVVDDLLKANISTASTPAESEAAAKTLEAVQPKSGPASSAVNVLKGLPARVYVQIRSESDRGTAEQIRSLLRTTGANLPGIELANFGPSTSELRFFHTEDKAQAEQLSATLTEHGVPAKATDDQALAKKINATVPFGQFELWLAPAAKMK